MRNVDGFNVTKSGGCLNCGGRLVPSRTGSLGITSTGDIAADLNVSREFSKITGKRCLVAVRGPAHEERTIRPVHEDLEYPGHVPAVGDVAKKTRVENLGLLLSHARSATPVGPARFGVLIVVVGREVNRGVEEA